MSNIQIKLRQRRNGLYFLLLVLVLSLSSNLLYAQSDNYKVFKLIHSESELAEGDTVVITSVEYEKVMGAINGKSKNNRLALSISTVFDEYIITNLDDVAELRLEKSGKNYWKLSPEEGKYLYTKGNSNNLRTDVSSKTDGYEKVSISIDGVNADVYFVENESKTTPYVLKYNVEYDLFNSYGLIQSESHGQIQFYKKISEGYFLLLGTAQTDNNQPVIDYFYESQAENTFVIARDFIADGGWYTLCLPFSLSADEIANQFKGAVFEEFSSVIMEGDSVKLNFTTVTGATKAGVPYIVKPIETVNLPIFEGKKIEVNAPVDVTCYTEDGKEYSFKGIFNPTVLGNDKTKWFVKSDGSGLVYSNNATSKLNALRAYFQIPEASSLARISTENDATAIEIPNVDSHIDTKVFDLSGRFVGTSIDGLSKGIYIVNKKKIIIK